MNESVKISLDRYEEMKEELNYYRSMFKIGTDYCHNAVLKINVEKAIAMFINMLEGSSFDYTHELACDLEYDESTYSNNIDCYIRAVPKRK